jgi:AcrR family transcriptional regulator
MAKAKEGKAPQQILNETGINQICEWITEGVSYRDIAKRLGISLGALTWWIDGKPERSHACACAREVAAQTYDEMALEVIESAADPFELSKAKEMAVHYRWRAKAANPKRYGEKQQVTHDGGMNVTLFDGEQARRMTELAYLKKDEG